MIESRQDHVELQGVSANAVTALMEFAYTGKLKIEANDMIDILGGATHLQMLDAVALCAERFLKALSCNTCVDTLNIAETFSLQGVKTAAVKYISKNFETVACNDQFLKLSVDHMCMFVESNDLCVKSELSLFKHVIVWIDFDRSEREEEIGRVMQHIRFAMMKPEELIHHVSHSPFMAPESKAHVYLDEALHYHILAAQQHLMQTPRTQIRADPGIVLVDTMYALKSGEWRSLDRTSKSIDGAGVAVVDDYLYVCGGSDTTCQRYDPRSNKWVGLTSMTVCRRSFTIVGIPGKLFAFGGTTTSVHSAYRSNAISVSKATDQAEVYSMETGTWNAISPMQGARKNAAACELDGKIYVSGGSTDTETRSTMWSYSIAENTWEERAPLLTPLQCHVMMTVKDDIYVIDRSNMAISCYSPTANQWSNIASGLDNISDVKQLVVSGVWVYVIGYVKSGESTALYGRYNMINREMESLPSCYSSCCVQPNYVNVFLTTL